MPTIFTRIIAGEIPGEFCWKDDICVAFADINPIATAPNESGTDYRARPKAGVRLRALLPEYRRIRRPPFTSAPNSGQLYGRH